MSKSSRVLDALMNGEQLTVKQIRSRYGVANPTALVDSLRKSGGFAIYSNARTNSKGETRNFYRIKNHNLWYYCFFTNNFPFKQCS